MTATVEELCRLLDERGVEWTYEDGIVCFSNGERWLKAWAYNDRLMCVSTGYYTPEQAIAATLGAMECKVESTTKWDWDRCEPYWVHELSCGHTVTTMEPEPPSYCPECGRQVKS